MSEETNVSQTEGKAEEAAKPKAEEKAEEKAGKPQETEPTPIERGESIIKGIDEGMKKYEKLVERQEKAAAQMLLGGKAAAGEATKTPEEAEKEKAAAEIDETLKRFD